MTSQRKKRVIVGVSGASGMPLALRLPRELRDVPGVETHLIVSPGAARLLEEECDRGVEALAAFADRTHDALDMAAGPASGSWRHDGMIVCPCSMSSLASIASGAGMNLLHRAADVTLKERRPLLLVPRETPLNLLHLENMRRLALAGATIMPFMPAFYARPRGIEDMLAHFCGRLLDQLGLETGMTRRWRDDQ